MSRSGGFLGPSGVDGAKFTVNDSRHQ
jgi:hypothetical protein